MTSRADWRRVSRATPCPICGRPKWCLIRTDGTVAICTHVESPRRVGDAGWLHRLKDGPEQYQSRYVRLIRLASGDAGQSDLARLAAQCQEAVDPGRLYHLATSLGLTVASLCHFGIGWSVEHRSWTFPMTNADGHVLGIRLRRPNGYKFAVVGGKEGLFIPSTVEGQYSLLHICEGPTDAAALLDMGFQFVVGRPSCTGGIRLLVELVRKWNTPEVVIVADGDEPGQRGADNLASVLVAYAPAVRVIAPPLGIKDIRAWLRAGGGRGEVEEATRVAAVRRLVIRAGGTGVKKG